MKISKRLIEGYNGLVASPNTISNEVIAVIGWQMAVKLFRLREQRTGSRGKRTRGEPSLTLEDAIQDEWLDILEEEMVYNTEADWTYPKELSGTTSCAEE